MLNNLKDPNTTTYNSPLLSELSLADYSTLKGAYTQLHEQSKNKCTPQVVQNIQTQNRELFRLIRDKLTEEKATGAIQPSEANQEKNRLKKIYREIETITPRRRNVEKKINKIVSRRLSNPTQELNRLMQSERVRNSIQTVSANLSGEFTAQEKIAYGRSLEVREAFKENYFTITHGQNKSLCVLNTFTKALVKETCGSTEKYAQFLRCDMGKGLSDLRGTDYYIDQIDHRGLTDHDFRRELLCGDCYLESTAECESALYFFHYNHNIGFSNVEGTKRLFQPIFEAFLPLPSSCTQNPSSSPELHAEFTLKKEALMTELTEVITSFDCGNGNLYSILIPKNKFFKYAYLSLPFGASAKNQYTHSHLEALQDGHAPNSTVDGVGQIPSEDYSKDAPQVRILTKYMRPEYGVHVVLNSSALDEERRKMEKRVSAIAHRLMGLATEYKTLTSSV
ncbi:MAG: hypothetical protein KDK40_04320 [Chlamydiia bacterium]|nr:hypothetical protein [Chlamydiia bacterium]